MALVAPRTMMAPEGQVLVDGNCGLRWHPGSERAEVLEVFIGSRVGGPGLAVERPVSIGEYR